MRKFAFEADLIKSARHPVLEPRPFERHKERLDISALSSHGGSDMFDITICHPLPPAQIRDGMENALVVRKKYGIGRSEGLEGSFTSLLQLLNSFQCHCRVLEGGTQTHIEQ